MPELVYNELLEAIRQASPDVHLGTGNYRARCSGWRNTGGRYATAIDTEWVHFLYDDTEVMPEFLFRIADTTSNNPSIGVVGGVSLITAGQS